MHKVVDKLFLLGGLDLEMQAIRQLLIEQHCPFEDAALSWSNARLSAYRSVLDTTDAVQIYGIELRSDVQPPDNYQLIDHHNELSQSPSSLEQVANLLGVALNRTQLLIAANDKGYIPALIAMQATAAEIQQIRCWDRAAQGVTSQDEVQAALDVQHRLSTNGLVIVQTTLSHFSPICDRLYPYERLLIFSEQEWTYYGPGIEQLKDSFSNLLAQGQCYYGGGTRGFFGLAKGVHTPDEIKQDVERIKQCIGDV